MSQATLALLSALVGAIVALLGTFLGGLRAEFSARVGAMKVVKSELEFARFKLRAALAEQRAWPSRYQLRSTAWESHCAQLASRLSSRTWDELQQLALEMELTDGKAAEISNGDLVWTDDFADELSQLQGSLDRAIEKLNDALTGAKARLRNGRVLTGVTIALIAVGVLATLPSTQSITSSTLADHLQSRSPGANQTICNESARLDGAYRCTIDFPACSGELEASTKAPSCGGARRDVYWVNTNNRCYTAALRREVTNGERLAKPPKKGRRLFVRWGCMDG